MIRSVSRISEAVGACTVLAATGVGVAGLSATSASAAVVGLTALHTVQSQSYSFTTSVKDTKGTAGGAGTGDGTLGNPYTTSSAGNGTTYTGEIVLGSKQFNYFNPSNGSAYDGVLTGVTVSIGNITRFGNSTVQGINAVGGNVTANLSGTFKTHIAGIPGLGTPQASQQTGTITNAVSRASGTGSPSNTSTFNLGTGGANSPAVNKIDFLSANQFSINVIGNVSGNVTTSNTKFGNASSGTINATAAGNLSVDYTYYYHGTPSFTSGNQTVSLDINFGNVTQGSYGGVLSSVFSLYNLPHDGNVSLGNSTIDLAFNSYDTLGDDTVLTVTAHNDPYGNSPVYINSNNSDTGDTELVANTSKLIDANLFTGNALGHYAATYYLYLNEDSGSTTGEWINTTSLTLTLEADIVPSHVPEPVTSSMFGAGLAGLIFLRRRKKRGDKDGLLGDAPPKAAA